MKILFLTLVGMESLNDRGIYSDLMREFVRRGNDVYIAFPTERRHGEPTQLKVEEHCQILKIWSLNIQKTNIVEKGIGTLMLESQFDRAIKKYWGDVKFDLVIYSTPPITFNNAIRKVKNRCGCRSYLMLKDIFPQNAVDLGMMKEGSLLHKMFRAKERKLYEISDRIGCMSPANCRYVIEHNPEVDASKVELCPNAVEPTEVAGRDREMREHTLAKYGLPADERLFIYGGNLGKPQGVDFLMDVVACNELDNHGYIVIVGNGTEYGRMAQWFEEHKPQRSKLMSGLPKSDYDELVRSCDVGLIFLDRRFTIPNFPSRLLSYIENEMPVLLATDKNSDMGSIAESEGFGLWCESGDLDRFMSNMGRMSEENIREMGKRGRAYMLDNYTAEQVAGIIL